MVSWDNFEEMATYIGRCMGEWDFFNQEKPKEHTITDLLNTDPALNQLAQGLIDFCPYKTLINVINWVYDNIKYDSETLGKHWTAGRILQEKRGICAHKAVLAVALLNRLGIPAACISGRTNYEKGEFHEWINFWMGEWTFADPTIHAIIGNYTCETGTAAEGRVCYETYEIEDLEDPYDVYYVNLYPSSISLAEMDVGTKAIKKGAERQTAIDRTYLQIAAPAELTITTTPDWAKIFVNGEYIHHVTPEILYLDPGTYIIRITKTKEYQPVEFTITLERGQKITKHFDLQKIEIEPPPVPDRGKLIVVSVPGYARIDIDGLYIHHVTPETVWVSPGEHTVRIYRKNYKEYKETFEILPYGEKVISIDLEEIPPPEIGERRTVIQEWTGKRWKIVEVKK